MQKQGDNLDDEVDRNPTWALLHRWGEKKRKKKIILLGRLPGSSWRGYDAGLPPPRIRATAACRVLPEPVRLVPLRAAGGGARIPSPRGAEPRRATEVPL